MRGIPIPDVLELSRQFVLDTGKPWDPEDFQVKVIEALCRGEDRVWLEIPEANAKTTLTAIIVLAHIFFVPDASSMVAAASRGQAMTLFDQAHGIIRRSPGLSDHFKPQSGHRRILCPASGGKMEVKPASATTGDGIVPTLPILEELHRQPGLELYRTWSGKLDKRHAQLLIISTSGAPGSEYETVKSQVLNDCERHGTVQLEGRALTVARRPGFELRLHGLQPGDDVEDIELVKEANPLRARTVAQLQAKRDEPTWNREHWARFTCGVPTRDSDSAVNTREWKALIKTEIPAAVRISAGLDLAWRHDTTAIAPFWMPSRDRRVVGKPEILIPPRDGTSLAFSKIKDAFLRLHERTPVDLVAMDMNAGGAVVADWLQDPDDGLGCEVVDIPTSNVVQAQVYAAWLEAVRMGWLEHPHDPDFDAHVLNAIAKPAGHDRYRFDRHHESRAARFQDRRVIDALIAASGVHWQQTASLEADTRLDNFDGFDPSDFNVTSL